ncbi:MAG: tetratricopeptide (TPR) repeat protein [Thermoproteota archaeon]|jgi:tetratricopeptide (TPR) repeat protein
MNAVCTKFFSVTLLLFAIYANKYFIKPIFKPNKEKTVYNIKSSYLRTISFGYRRLFSDILWIKTLLESDLDHYKSKDLNSWMFLRFKNIITLDPHFYYPYLFGSVYLSIVKDDISGASYILERGLKKYPLDYNINYFGGFHYYFEAKDYEKANHVYDHMIKVFPKKVPQSIKNLRVKSLQKINQNALALSLLLENYNQLTVDQSPILKKKLKEKITNLRKKIQNSSK